MHFSWKQSTRITSSSLNNVKHPNRCGRHYKPSPKNHSRLKVLSSLYISDDYDISSHIIEIGSVGAQLKRICNNSRISIEDIQTASLILSLAETFTSVTSPFKQHEEATFKYVSRAVKGHIVSRKNRFNQSATNSSTSITARTDATTGAKQNGKSQRQTNETYLGTGLRNLPNRSLDWGVKFCCWPCPIYIDIKENGLKQLFFKCKKVCLTSKISSM